MNAELLNKNILRFVFLGLIQGVILQSIDLAYVEFFIFPLFILMFPLGLSDSLFLLICFIFGLYIDMFYNTMGLFISTAVFMGAIKKFILALFEPRGGYEPWKTFSRANYGINWFVKYTSVFLLLNSLWFCLLEDLHFSWMWLVRFLLNFVLSFILVMSYQFVFNPKD